MPFIPSPKGNGFSGEVFIKYGGFLRVMENLKNENDFGEKEEVIEENEEEKSFIKIRSDSYDVKVSSVEIKQTDMDAFIKILINNGYHTNVWTDNDNIAVIKFCKPEYDCTRFVPVMDYEYGEW